MDFWEAIQERHSVRDYDPRVDLSSAEVERILAAAISAPSAGNCQPWHFVVVRDRAMRRALAEAAYGQGFVSQAPVVIVVCADPARSARRYRERGADLYCLQDTAAAAENLLLAATALGLGSCWVGAFNEEAAARVLQLRPHLRPVALVTVGRPLAPASGRTPRRPVSSVVTYR